MEINNLIEIIRKKIKESFNISFIKIEDKTFLHKKHKLFKKNKFHIKITINSLELKSMKPIDANRKIYKLLNEETEKYIHSLQIVIN